MKKVDQAWVDMPAKMQREVLNRVWLSAKKKLEDYPNVVGVGIGVRYEAGQFTDVQCVTVQVRGAKWPRNRKGALPEQLPVEFPDKRTRLGVSVPVDVVEAPRPRIQAAAGAKCVANLRGLTNPGVVCCLVRIGSNPQPFALSCHHVVYFTKHRPLPTAAELPEFSMDVAAQRVGPPVGYFDLSRCDAAIVPFENAKPGDELIQGRRLTGWADDNSDIPKVCTILTPNGPPVQARYTSLVAQTIEGYCGNNTAYTFPEVLRCQFTQGMTYAGDSGSPVIDGLGRLIGMHIAGDANYSYIMPTYRIQISFTPTIVPILQLSGRRQVS